MLILSRKLNESLKIGDKITLKVIGLQEGQVKIGIDAPDDVKIYRSEIYDLIQKSNQEAAAASKLAAAAAAKRLSKTTTAARPAGVVKLKRSAQNKG